VSDLSQVTPAEKAHAIVRWKEGHQAFHVYLVVINTTIEQATGAIETGDCGNLCSYLDRLAVLYDAATATMQYTASFPPHVYEQAVRPSMAPPLVVPGFSGTLNTEHRIMVVGLKGLARALRQSYGSNCDLWAPEIRRSWAAVEHSKRENLEKHTLICSRFVPAGASLLREYFSRRKSQSF
jgi:hypothetical protein